MIKNISTQELANCIGTTQGFASQIKTGHRKLPTKYCIQVSVRFGIPLHELRPDVYPPENALVGKRITDLQPHERRISDRHTNAESKDHESS